MLQATDQSQIFHMCKKVEHNATVLLKNHTHVKMVGAHPRISVCHLLMNLKNNSNRKCKYFNFYKNKI